MATALVVPVLWKDATIPCIQGHLDVSASELPFAGLAIATVQDLIAVLNDKFHRMAASDREPKVRYVKSILLYGTRLNPDRLLDSAIVLLSAGCPRLVATTCTRPQRLKTTRIFVDTPTDSSLLLKCTLYDTIDEIKHKIQERTRISVADQLLVFAGKPMEGDHTLIEYNAYEMCTLHLTMRLRGGFVSGKPFADLSDDSLRHVRNFAVTGRPWRTAGKGLNLDGRCKNSSCEAFGKWVLHQYGYNSFNLLLDDDIKCPMCASAVTPLTCLFTDCVWRYEGIRSHDQCYISSPWMDALERKKYHRFDVDECHGTIDWLSLLIVVQSSQAAKTAKLVIGSPTTTKRKDNSCSVCWSPSSTKEEFVGISCGHNVHQACMREWSTWCKRTKMLLSCPVCRKDLSKESVVPPAV